MTDPQVIWKPVATTNYWHGTGQAKVAVVCHTTGGSLESTDNWFNNPAASASTNYAVGLAGEIHGYIDPAGPDAPYANGLVRLPSGNFPAMLVQQGGINPNFWTVSIEHEGMPTPSIPTQEMFVASVRLAAYTCKTFGIPADRSHFFSHTEIDNQKPDPGWSEQFWGVYLAAVNAAINGAEDNMALDPETQKYFDERWTGVFETLGRLEKASGRLEKAVYFIGAAILAGAAATGNIPAPW